MPSLLQFDHAWACELNDSITAGGGALSLDQELALATGIALPSSLRIASVWRLAVLPEFRYARLRVADIVGVISYRRKGVGTALLNEIEIFAKSQGIDALTMAVTTSDARRFFESCVSSGHVCHLTAMRQIKSLSLSEVTAGYIL